MMDDIPPVSRFLTEIGIPHQIFRHSGPVSSLEQAALERGQLPDQIIRSIVFRLGKGEFIMVLVAGPNQISWPALRTFLGVSRLSMASEKEVFDATGYKLGAVSPFGLPAKMRILADINIFLPEVISIGSGERGVAIIMKSMDLKKGLGEVDLGQFTSQSN
jgi:Cys-tRNA(Pro)/Cys-tRNA(Cys) deacylase